MVRKIYHLAVEATLDVIGGKWKPIILCHLGGQTLRASELDRLMPNASPRVITKQLRELEKDNIVKRKVYNQVPPKVEYSLTKEGRSLREILLAMSDWGEQRVKNEQAKGEDVTIMNHDKTGYRQM